MTSERGGPTTQSGILYQNSVAALYLGRLCSFGQRPSSEFVQKVKVEASEPVDDIVITFDDDHTEYIQAKENLQINSKAWKKLWKDFDAQYHKDTFRKGKDRLVLYLGTRHDKYDALKSFCSRAGGNANFYDWQERLSKKQAKFLDNIFSNISPKLKDNEAFREFISHVKVEIRTKKYIQEDLAPKWMPESNKPSRELFRLLRDIVAEKSANRGVFDALKLRELLLSEISDLIFTTPTNIEELRNAIQDCSSQLRQQRCTISNTNHHIENNAVFEIMDWVKSENESNKNVSILLDQAGMGKSVVLHDVLCELEKQQIDTLAIKADRQLSNVDTFSDIPISLGLPQPVEQIVGQLARLGQVVVIIDQLDALSLSLAHDQKALDIAFDLVARLRRIPNVKIILSCRIFDYNSDPRFKKIKIQNKFTLKEFSKDDVQVVLSILNIEYDLLPKTTQNLLSIPLHLDLFSMALGKNKSSEFQSHSISSIQELYDLLWENIILRREHKTPSISERIEVLHILTNHMDRERKTSAPLSLFHTKENEDLENTVLWLASNGIIIESKTEWSFLHQTFFDYSYARQFAESKKDLVSTILSSAQGILERPKLLYILSYMRGKQTREYLQAFQQLLNAPDLRFHLYDHMFRWFGALPDPSEDEWFITQRILFDENKQSQILRAMHGNSAWFDLLYKSLLPTWVSQETNILDTQTIPYLESMAEVKQEKIATLLKPYLGKNDEWLERIYRVLSKIRKWTSIEAIKLYEGLIYKFPSLCQAPMYEIGIVAQAHPETGVRLLKYILDNATDEYKKKRQKNIDAHGGIYKHQIGSGTIMDEFRILTQGNLDDAFRKVSTKKPELFVDKILPWLEDSISLQGVPKENKFRYSFDYFSYGWYQNSLYSGSPIIQNLISALIEVAKSDIQKFRKIANRLVTSSYSTPHQLLAHVYQAVPKIYAQDAFLYLIKDTKRLNLGDSEEYDSRRIISAIFPFLSNEYQIKLEIFIISYNPIRKKSVIGDLKWRGIEQYRLLRSIPLELMSLDGKKHLRLLEHKFPDYAVSNKPFIGEGGGIGSPIPEENAKKMSNQNWLSALQRYQKEQTHNEFLKGGARELSAVLKNEIIENPSRFYKLLKKIPNDVDDAYVIAYLNGFAESTDAPAEWLFDTVRRFSKDRDRQIKRSIAWALEKRISDEIPNDLITLLYDYLHEEMGDNELWWSQGKNNGDVYSSYYNSKRGVAFYVLMAYYANKDDAPSVDARWKLIEFAATDNSTALRIGAIHHLTYLIRYSRTRAIILFEKLMQGQDVLLNSPYVRKFIYWALYKNFLKLRPYIEAMLKSKLEETQKQGAELACIASLSDNSSKSEGIAKVTLELVEQTIIGTVSQRQGAARIFSHNLTGNASEICEEKLLVLLDNDDDQIQRSIEGAFSLMKSEHFYSLKSFIEAYAKKTRIIGVFFSEFMLEHGRLDSVWTLNIVNELLDNELWEENRMRSIGVDNLIRLVLKIYNSPMTTANTQKIAMDLFDKLIQQFSRQTYKILNEWDAR